MRLATFGLIASVRAQNPSCYTCQAAYDHNGNELPFNDLSCFDDEVIPEEYSRECPNSDDICLLQVDVRWRQGGSHDVSLMRGCGPTDTEIPESGCLGNYETYPMPMQLFKICGSTCTGDNCNDFDLYNEVLDLHSEGNELTVDTCHTCSYDNNNGDVEGQINCADGGGEIASMSCPKYANAACFTAAMWSDDVINGNDVTFEEDHRGCSAFNFNTLDSDCQSGQNGATGHFAECKSTCNDDNCNSNKLAKRKQCISCSGTRASDNSTVGIGDDNCWELMGSINTEDCDQEDDVCYTEMLVDWLPRGAQETTVRRGCARKDSRPGGECLLQVIHELGFQYKDCLVNCDSSNCNLGLDAVASLFSSENPQDSCHACRYHQTNNGDVDGEPLCLDMPDSAGSCPMYANTGCYTSSSIHFIDGEQREDVNRGCSSFDKAAIGPTNCTTIMLPDNDGIIYNFAVCKDVCTGKTNCNSDPHNKPDFPLDGVWSACQVCNVVVDQLNNTVGVGDAACFDGDESLVELCPNGEDRCAVDMEIDWFPRGHHTYRLTRGCSSSPAYENCISGSTSLLQYVDCQIDCNPHISGNGCNSGLDAISEKLYDPMGVDSCYVCNYTENIDGSVQGQPTCGDAISSGGVIQSLDCPKYSNKACYHAASFHVDYVSDGEFTDDFRGCSPFEENRDDFCELTVVNGLDHLNCRDTCSTNDCNTQKIQKRRQCYSCQGMRDSAGNSVGVSDDNCFDRVNEGMLVDCGTEDEYCIDEMLADWFVTGGQFSQISRGCSATPAMATCTSGDTINIKYKDCFASCEGSGCNNDMTVGDKFIGSYQQPSCYSCKYVEKDNGDVDGNKNCPNGPPETTTSCPNYASAACYTGASVHNFEGDVKQEVYKGCSSFEITDNGGFEEHNITIGTDEVQYAITKTTCRGADCNAMHVPPIDDGSGGIGNRCQICQVTVDQFNRTVGIGQPDCWEGPGSQFLQECGPNSLCRTELEIDWFAKGHFNYRLMRGCSSVPAPTDCYGGGTSMIQYKDCSVSCDPSKDGPGCNSGLEGVGEKYSTKTVSNCYQCEYVQDQDGNVNGLPGCGDEVTGGNDVPMMQCPLYADSACFWAASFHQDFTGSGKQIEDDHRGCSPFALERHNECESADLSGIEHINCKDTCESDNCNKDRVVKTLQCHSCSAVMDSEGNSVGIGDERCFFDATNTPLVDCPIDSDTCSTEMLVDWFSKGAQQTTIRRGCAKVEITRPCAFGQSDRIMYKDCFDDCHDQGCNTGLAVADQFDEGINQKSCYACRYIEEDSGNVSGNRNCPDSPDQNHDQMSMDCPAWAQNGCYTGSAVHNVGSDDLLGRREEVYKGCSTFWIGEETDRHTAVLENGVEYSLIKQTCQGDNCNLGHDAPSTPGADFRCHQCTIRKDHQGTTIGVADESCWMDPLPRLLSPCATGICITEMLVDWNPAGEQVVTMERKCGNRPVGHGKCVESDFGTYMWKDCLDYCEISGCNNEFSYVAGLFDQGNDLSCYSCKYGRNPDGSIMDGSNEKCSLNDVTGEIESNACPVYANAACYTSLTSNNNDVDLHQEDYKGCSTFRLEAGANYCNTVDVNGETVTGCKETCDSNNCNSQSHGGGNMCQVCEVTVDQFNNTIGFGQDGCWNGDAQYHENCGVGSLCMTELEIDWFARGDFSYRVIRGCAQNPAPTTCYEGSSSLVQIKDCSVTCDPVVAGQGCNDGLDEVGHKYSTQQVSNCFQCEYVQDEDGNVEGTPSCGEAIINNGDVPSYQCPLYADSACYWAASFHKDFSGSDDEIEDDHRGCSPFVMEKHNQCESGEFAEVQYVNCRDTCESNNCNVDRVVKTLQCHSCSAIHDSEGNVVGLGDDRCFFYSEDTPLIDCPIGYNMCETELLVDWYPRGAQQTTVRRGCAFKGAFEEACISQTSDRMMVKDCFDDCLGNGCNTGLAVGDKFNEGYNQDTCYACEYQEEDNGSISGNNKCGEAPTDQMRMPCPNWATNGCYTGTAVHNVGGVNGAREEVHKGCSTFWLGTETDYHNETLENGMDYAFAKQTCRGKDCNVGQDMPAVPDSENLCYQCTIQKDHLGNTIGVADDSCWTGPLPRLLSPCAETSVCITEMLVDWYPKGEQVVTFQRKCGPRPVTPGGNQCTEENFNTYMWKDCIDYCETTGCNSEFDNVANLFDQGNDLECYSCKYARGNDGTILNGSNEKCSLGDVSGQIDTVTCPTYANAACYSASTWHMEKTDAIQEDFKGCSTFRFEDSEHYCEPYDINGVAYNSCKETCDTANCNGITHSEQFNYLACYTCDVTFDSFNKTVGYGHPSCFSNTPDAADIQECRGDEMYCTVDIETDWVLFGEQTTRVRRGCSKTPAPENCFQSISSDGLFMLKDCATSCETTGCNNRLQETADLFDHPTDQPNCFTCQYIERDNGDVEGNKYCAEEPDQLVTASYFCPVYANAACYTGTNAHYTSAQVLNEEVYKGCSTFNLGDMNCNIVHSDESGDYGVCKQTCTGPNCNRNHVRPCVPTDTEDCGYNPDGSSAVNVFLSLIALLPVYFVL